MSLFAKSSNGRCDSALCSAISRVLEQAKYSVTFISFDRCYICEAHHVLRKYWNTVVNGKRIYMLHCSIGIYCFKDVQKVRDTGIQKSDILQEMVVVSANPYLLKEAFGSPSHQPNNAASAFLAIDLAVASSEQTLAACYSVLHLHLKTTA